MNERAGTSLSDAYDVWVAALQNAWQELVETGAALVPNLLGAVLLLLLGWVLAWLLSRLILRLGRGMDRLSEAMRLRVGTEAATQRWPMSRIVAVAVFWLVMLFFAAVAADVLGLAGVAGMFSGLLAYLPVLLLTAGALVVIVAVSGTVSALVARGARRAGVANAVALGALVRVALITMAFIIALAQVGIDAALLVNVFTVIAAAFFGGAALAFGLGASGAVRNLIASTGVRRSYRVGQRVRVAGQEGEILELGSVAVMLETEAGRVQVPARLFDEEVSVLLDGDGADA